MQVHTYAESGVCTCVVPWDGLFPSDVRSNTAAAATAQPTRGTLATESGFGCQACNLSSRAGACWGAAPHTALNLQQLCWQQVHLVQYAAVTAQGCSMRHIQTVRCGARRSAALVPLLCLSGLLEAAAVHSMPAVQVTLCQCTSCGGHRGQ